MWLQGGQGGREGGASEAEVQSTFGIPDPEGSGPHPPLLTQAGKGKNQKAKIRLKTTGRGQSRINVQVTPPACEPKQTKAATLFEMTKLEPNLRLCIFKLALPTPTVSKSKVPGVLRDCLHVKFNCAGRESSQKCLGKGFVIVALRIFSGCYLVIECQLESHHL